MVTTGLGISSIGFGLLGGATLPNGNVKAVPYVPNFVGFPQAASLVTSSSTIADSSKITFSFLIYLPSTGIVVDPTRNQYGPVFPIFSSADVNQVVVGINVVVIDNSNAAIAIELTPDSPGTAFQSAYWVSSPTAYLRAHGFPLGKTFPLDRVVQIFGSVDTSAAADYTNQYQIGFGVPNPDTPYLGPNGTPPPGFIYIDGQTANWDGLPGVPTAAYRDDNINFAPNDIPPEVTGFPIVNAFNGIKVGLLSIPGWAGNQSNLGFWTTPPALALADFQLWSGIAIDPTASLNTSVVAVNPQPNFDNAKVDWSLMQMLIDAMVAGGVDPQMMMTVYNVETQYGTVFDPPSSIHQGVFQFTQDEINKAGAVGSNFNNDANAAAFVFYNTVPGSNSWITPALNRWGADPTGIYRYTVYNQGAGGAGAIWNATAGTTLNQAAATANVPVGHYTGQSWANGMPKGVPNRWAGISPIFNTALTGADLVSTWVSRLNAIWANASADAASRLTGPPSTNIEAFVNPDGTPVAPAAPAAFFGQQSILFSGRASNFQINQGTSGAFSVFQGPLFDFTPPSL